jgi:uncharacterized protein (TIGR02118 family)
LVEECFMYRCPPVSKSDRRRLLEPLATSHRRSSRPPTGGRRAQRKTLDSTNPASGEPGAIHRCAEEECAMIKTVTLLKRRPDLRPEDFHRHWRDVHAPLVLRLPGIRRYVQCRPVHIPGKEPRFDGIAEVWYENLDSLRATMDSDACKQLLADELNFMGPSTQESIFLIVEEDAIL